VNVAFLACDPSLYNGMDAAGAKSDNSSRRVLCDHPSQARAPEPQLPRIPGTYAKQYTVAHVQHIIFIDLFS
jgi:hypothetical protein